MKIKFKNKKYREIHPKYNIFQLKKAVQTLKELNHKRKTMRNYWFKNKKINLNLAKAQNK